MPRRKGECRALSTYPPIPSCNTDHEVIETCVLERRAELLSLDRLTLRTVLQVLGNVCGSVRVLHLATPHIVQLRHSGRYGGKREKSTCSAGVVCEGANKCRGWEKVERCKTRCDARE